MSDALCNRLSDNEHTNSRAKTQHLRRRTSRHTFAASFIEAKPEEKTTNSTKKLLRVYHDYSQIVNAMTRIKEIKFRDETFNALELTKTFKRCQPIQTTKNQVKIQAGSTYLPTIFLQIEKSIL